MKEQLIQLLTQLPQVLSGNAVEITNLSKEFTIPKFHSPKKLFPEEYILDRINNQIITLLKSK